ncbi:MAG TPA: DUF3488 domain-containing protein, partial [Candidatus Tenderia electrophaga]|nr:DUF3488 domain-containing protein [Candidatus Tenderia electrophaga]
MSGAQITVLDQRAMTWLLAGLGLTILPHSLYLPIWVSALALAIGGWRWLAAQRNWPLPHNKLKLLLTLALVVAIFANYGTVAGRDSGTALLVMMMGLKLMELRQRRDVMVLMFLAYFLLITHFIFSQSIAMAVYVMCCAWLLLSLHMHLTSMERRPVRHSLRTAAGLMLLGLPMMLLLFVLFPRIEGPIWGLPDDVYAGMTGIGDSMSPGAISSLSQSNAIAFRVKFDAAVPTPAQRYWRGPVLWLTDGRNWNIGPEQRPASWQPAISAERSSAVSYTVTLEPHNQKWLFALDIPATASEHGQISSELQLIASKKVRKRLKYHMTSYLSYNTGQLNGFERRLGLFLPKNRNPRTLALGRALQLQSRSDAEVVEKALAMFRQQPFVYSLRPPLLDSNHPSDQFLFETRIGFCEHFASSFTMLMRAAGIPARVVTGYQGAELNPVDDYYIVRQRDAHAWSEVWLPKQGWVRVDPTAAVAPERIESSIDISQLSTTAVQFTVPHSDMLSKAWQQFNLNLDAINNRWNQLVLGYGPDQQQKFLQNLGLD